MTGSVLKWTEFCGCKLGNGVSYLIMKRKLCLMDLNCVPIQLNL